MLTDSIGVTGAVSDVAGQNAHELSREYIDGIFHDYQFNFCEQLKF